MDDLGSMMRYVIVNTKMGGSTVWIWLIITETRDLRVRVADSMGFSVSMGESLRKITPQEYRDLFNEKAIGLILGSTSKQE